MSKADSNPSAFERDLVALIPQLRAFGRFLSGNVADGDELAQETLAKAWSGRESFKAGTNLKAWTFRILRNEFISGKRRSWRTAFLEPVFASQIVAADNAEAVLMLDDVRRALRLLPEQQREVLILVGAAGVAYEEAADILQTPIGTVKSRASRARTSLARALDCGALPSDDCPANSAMSAIVAQIKRTVSREP